MTTVTAPESNKFDTDLRIPLTKMGAFIDVLGRPVLGTKQRPEPVQLDELESADLDVPQPLSLKSIIASLRPVTAVLGIVLVAAYVVQSQVPVEDAVQLFAKVNSRIADGEVWRLFSAMFLHADVFHLLNNVAALFIFGTVVERYFGGGEMAIIFLLSGVAGVIASFCYVESPSLGASGGVFGLIGGGIALLIKPQVRMAPTKVNRLVGSTAYILGSSFLHGVMVPGIDNFAHLGGLLAGACLGFILPVRSDIKKLVS